MCGAPTPQNADVGFDPVHAPDVSAELFNLLLALALECVCDVIAMTVMTYQGVPRLDLWSGGSKGGVWIFWLLSSQALVTNLLFWALIPRPLFWDCRSSAVCSCSFADANDVLDAFCCGL